MKGYVVLQSFNFAREYINSLLVNAPLVWKVEDRNKTKEKDKCKSEMESVTP